MTQSRPAALRALLWGGLVLSVVLGVPLVVLGLADVTTSGGQTALCCGLVLLVCAAAGAGRELAERAALRDPPQPRLTTLDGEPALLLPRHRGRSVVAAAALSGLAAVAALGAVLAIASGSVVGAVLLAAVAAALVVAGAPWRVVADGVWCTPTRLVHEHDNLRWSLAWDDVAGSDPRQPVPVRLHPGRRPPVRRRWDSLRLAQRPSTGDTRWIDARHLAGGPALVSYVVVHAVAEPGFRAALGSPASLPPTADG